MNFNPNIVSLNSMNKITGQGYLQPLQSKPKAYINPQIVNCAFLRNSKSSGNKIHINPNFKGNGVQYSENSSLLGSCYSNTNPLNKEVQVNTIATNVRNNISKFKKVNKITTSNNLKWPEEKISVPQPSTSTKYSYPTPYKKVNAPVVYKPSHRFTSKTKIINKLKTKVINNNAQNEGGSLKIPLINKNCIRNEFSLKRNVKSPALRVATLVRNKYKYIKSPKSKYKIDKRKKIPVLCKSKQNRVKDIRKLFPKNFYYKVRLPFNNIYSKRCYHPSLIMKNIHSWRKGKPSENFTKNVNRFPNKTVVKIGGILYKSTMNKLTIAPCKSESSDKTALITPKRKVKKYNHILYVRGERFILDKNGKTLKRQVTKTEENKTTPKRIDIGGVTYIRKSNNVLVRTNVHQARHLVNKAKNKSIATLNKLYKKSSLPCMIFHKFGKCMRHAKGLCMYKHDIKNIAICKRFLKGSCEDEKCLLSHEVIQEKMETCMHFLNGNCTRENCPYLHVKLNKNSAICEDFLHGFCNLGTNCSKRHEYICPELDRTGTCSQRSKCQYPHKTEKTKGSTIGDKTLNQTETPQYFIKSSHSLAKKKSRKRKRALIKEVKDGEKPARKESTIESVHSLEPNDVIECVPKRVKIDDLPCFIPLKSDP